MKRTQILLLLIISFNTASPADLPNEWERVKELIVQEAILIEVTQGTAAQEKFMALVNGESLEETRRRKTAIDIILNHEGPGLKEHKEKRANARRTAKGLDGFERPEEKIIEYLKENNDQPPSQRWLNQNLWMSDKLYQRTGALEIIKQHSLQSERAAKYLADYKEAQKAGQPMKPFKAPLDKIVTYMKNNKGQAPSKDVLDEYLGR
ncbi:MAG: hypothetical protein EBU90_25670 [Proteobacteria bacterium]|nr:hypothetical protein [Pseudomonadota bacterium]